MAFQPKDTKERVLHRMKIARGHMDKVIHMIEDDAYCVDTLHQSQAIQAALKKVDSLVLNNHLRTCVVDGIKNGREDVISEIIEVFDKK